MSPVLPARIYSLLLAALALASALAASASVRIEQDFDSGSLLLSGTRIRGDTVTLAGRDNFNSGRWKWIHFRVDGIQGRTLRFEIGDNLAPSARALEHLNFVYSHDQIRWRFFDESRHDANRGRFSFRNHTPFEHDTVWIAFSLPYPYSRVASLVDFLRLSPYVFPTASSDARLVIGQSSGGIDDTGRFIPPHDLFGFRITDGTTAGPKARVIIISGVHPNETPANHVTEGLLQFLVSEEPEAVELRRRTEFFIYPMVNPDARYAGFNRSTVQHPARDANRFWHEELYVDMQEIRTVAEAMKRDTQSEGVAFFIDFHSWTASRPKHFIFAEEHTRESAFWQRLIGLEPEHGFRAVNYPGEERVREAGRSTWFATVRLGARHAITAETKFIDGENTDRFRRMGRHYGLALHADLSRD